MKRHFIVAFGLIAAVLCACGAPEQHTYSAEPINSKVVDASTGEPIQGAVVVAYWELYQGSITGDGMPCGAANVEEAVTGKDGRFHIPGWGPVKGACGVMRGGEPQLYVFKAGYGYQRLANDYYSVDNPPSVSISQWNGRAIILTRFVNPDLRLGYVEGSYESDFEELNFWLGQFVVHMPRECNWRKIPNTLLAIEAETRKFSKALGYPLGTITTSLVDNDKWFQRVAPRCGSPKQFIENLEK